MNKTVAVTGGAGFIGSNLTEALAKRHRVIVIDNFSSGSRKNLAGVRNLRNVRIENADVRNKKHMEEITRGVHTVYHLAVVCVRKSFEHPFLVHDVNATGTLIVALASAKNHVSKFVYVSSSEVYGTAQKSPMVENHALNPTTIYGASKLAGEEYCKSVSKQFGLPVTIVRPFNTYGYHEQFRSMYGEVIPRFTIRLLNNLPPIIFGDGKQTRDFTFVTDTVAGIIQAEQSDNMMGETVNIAYGEEVSIRKLATILARLLGKDIKPTNGQKRPNDVRRHWADITKAKKILQYGPKISIEDGLRLYLDWFVHTYKPPYGRLLKHITERNW